MREVRRVDSANRNHRRSVQRNEHVVLEISGPAARGNVPSGRGASPRNRGVSAHHHAILAAAVPLHCHGVGCEDQVVLDMNRIDAARHAEDVAAAAAEPAHDNVPSND